MLCKRRENADSRNGRRKRLRNAIGRKIQPPGKRDPSRRTRLGKHISRGVVNNLPDAAIPSNAHRRLETRESAVAVNVAPECNLDVVGRRGVKFKHK